MPTKSQIKQEIEEILENKSLEGYSKEVQDMYKTRKHELDTFYQGNMDEYIKQKTSDYNFDITKSQEDIELYKDVKPESSEEIRKKIYDASRIDYYKESYAMGLDLSDEAVDLIDEGLLDLSNVKQNNYQTLKDIVKKTDPKIKEFVKNIDDEIGFTNEINKGVRDESKKFKNATPKTSNFIKGLDETQKAQVLDYYSNLEQIAKMDAVLKQKEKEMNNAFLDYQNTSPEKNVANQILIDAKNKASEDYTKAVDNLKSLDQFKEMHKDMSKNELTNDQIKSVQNYLSEKEAAFNKNHNVVGQFFAKFLPTWMYKGAEEYQEIQDIKNVLQEKNIPTEPIKENQVNTREKVSDEISNELGMLTDLNMSKSMEKDMVNTGPIFERGSVELEAGVLE